MGPLAVFARGAFVHGQGAMLGKGPGLIPPEGPLPYWRGAIVAASYETWLRRA